MKMSDQIGVSRGGRATNVHENGQRAVSLPVWGKEDHAGMARSASSSVSALPLESMIKEFMEKEGRKPTKLFSTAERGTPFVGKIYNEKELGYIGLDIEYGSHDNYLA